MSISKYFFDTYAIAERYTVITNSFGEELKTWTVSTTIQGRKQKKSGSKNIIFDIEKIRSNETFYCPASVNLSSANDRLLFSTNSFSFMGNSSATTNLISTNYGALYFCNAAFSSYVYGDYIRYSSASTSYVIENFDYYKITFIYELFNRHYQIDIEEDNKNRI